MKKLLLITFSILLLSGIAFAAQPKNFWFKDIKTEDTWYFQAVSDLFYNGKILQGYPDGTFGPDKSVNRAELAVMLKRFRDYLIHPEGKEHWKTYSNKTASFSVAYPPKWTVQPSENNTAFTFLAPSEDTDELFWGISLSKKNDKPLSQYIGDLNMLENPRITEEKLTINNLSATKMKLTLAEDPNFYEERVFIEKDDTIYQLGYRISGYSNQKNPDFEHFYSSFVALP